MSWVELLAAACVAGAAAGLTDSARTAIREAGTRLFSAMRREEQHREQNVGEEAVGGHAEEAVRGAAAGRISPGSPDRAEAEGTYVVHADRATGVQVGPCGTLTVVHRS